MSKKEKNNELEAALKRLEKSARKIVDTRGYTKEVEKIKILSEMIREQFINEGSSRTTR